MTFHKRLHTRCMLGVVQIDQNRKAPYAGLLQAL
jgi:hypothetical protein